jgi:multidrug efflux pump subunit AcrA (membrane-fusion protein)
MDSTILQPQPSTSESNQRQLNDAPAHAPRQARTRTILAIAFIVLAVFAGFLAKGIVYRSERDHALASDAAAAVSTPAEVMVVHPVAPAAALWSLPGTTQAIQDSIVYARISGYLGKRYVDIGDAVKSGQLLAEIQSPEIDQELSQAKANLQQAYKQLDLQKANLELARVTEARTQEAAVGGAISQETLDQAVASFNVAQASVAAAQATIDSNAATVQQYQAITAFERVLAPFDGVITQRNVDVGALITAGSPTNNTSASPTSVTGAATGMFEVSRIDTLRVFVNVPQVVAPNVTVGMAADVSIRGQLASPVPATVTRTANALDPGTRTLLTEVDVANTSHKLLPGAFVYVGFKIAPSGRRWDLPATALIFNADGTQVMLVGPDDKLHLQKVTVGRDFGDSIEIQGGLSGGETVVEQPDVSLREGQSVIPVLPDQAMRQ